MTVLITGGGGYIASHMALHMLEMREPFILVDRDFSRLPPALRQDGVKRVTADISDASLEAMMRDQAVDAIIHFAGSISVAESVAHPADYYDNNVSSSIRLFEMARRSGVSAVLFSSSAAVYGSGDGQPFREDDKLEPISPYGRSKLMAEWALNDIAAAGSFDTACLRYFNVAGADPAGRAGQSGAVATHIIRIACQAALGRRSGVSIFGGDYPTADGTCLRDYIHVCDLVDIHYRMLRRLRERGGRTILNCGYGHGHSVREIIETVKSASGVDFPVDLAERRGGDPASLVADIGKLKTELSWSPRFDDVARIVRSALRWEEKLAENGLLASQEKD